jgi:hypothetical protein
MGCKGDEMYYIGSIIKLKMYEDCEYLNMVIGYTEEGYVTVIYPYGLVEDSLFIVKKHDILKELYKGYDSRLSCSLGEDYGL